MEEERVTYISIQLFEKLRNPSPVPTQFSIFKVPDQLRKVKANAYEPHLVSIGPYHRGKPQLQGMEEYKMRFLRQLFKRKNGRGNKINEEDVLKCVQAMGALEKRARQCYQESSFNLDSEEFVQMMILDSCFIIELIRSRMDDLKESDDPNFVVELNLYSICRDLLLLENQLPFFVLLELFNLTKLPNQNCNYLISMITRYLQGQYCIGFIVNDAPSNDLDKSKHLLDLIHNNWLPSSTRTSVKHMTERDSSTFIRCATELREAGIKFRKVIDGAQGKQQRNLFHIRFKNGRVDGAQEKQQRNLFDIRFKNGTIEIPTLTIDDETESFLRNIMAYEQLPLAGNLCYVTDYVVLMDRLIDSKKDVQLLCRSGIINNRLGDDEVIATLFNRLGDYVIPSCPDFLYSELFKKVNKHCSKKHNKWMAKLRHDYFNSPWAMISFLAAVALLILTSLQTIYTVVTYYDK